MRKNRLHPFVEAVLDTSRRRRLLGPDDHVLVALSAGPDSTALLAAVAALRDAGHVAAVHALHVDHRLRPGAEEDGACAAASCAALAVPFEQVGVDVLGGNVQAAARTARYAALRTYAARVGASRIATGHTRTDQAETVLLRLLRGSGARGLAGIPARRGAIVRPLIDRSRAEVLAFLRDSGLAWREDPTNATPRFTRNRLRHEVWPAILALAPSAERSIARAADLLRDDERALSRAAREVVGDATAVSAEALVRVPLAARYRVVRRLWRNATGRAAGLEAHHVRSVLRLAEERRPRRVALPRGFEARCRYGAVEIGPVAREASAFAAVEVSRPGRYDLPGLPGSIEIAAEHPAEVPWPVLLRTRLPGDRFRPDGGAGSKKLKSWLIDRRVPREVRDGLIVVAREGTILAVPELGAVAQGLGPRGAGLSVRLHAGS